MDCLRAAEDDSPCSSTCPDTAFPTASLLHDFAKEGKKCQDAIAFSGGVPLLVELLPSGSGGGSGVEAAIEAASALCLIAIGSEEGRLAFHDSAAYGFQSMYFLHLLQHGTVESSKLFSSHQKPCCAL